MNNPDCIFCGIISGRIPCTKIFENQSVLAFLDIHPAAEGHVLVVPKTHVERIDQADGQVLSEIGKVLPKLTGAVKKAIQADGYNVLCNNGPASGQAVGHLHFHIIPRKTGDNVMKPWKPIEYHSGRLQQIEQKINAELVL